MFKALANRIKSTRLWRVFFGPAKWQVTLYFDGPRSQWEQKPSAAEILAQRSFRSRDVAEVWAHNRLHGLSRVAAVVSPL